MISALPVSLNSQEVPKTALTGVYFTLANQSIYDVCLQLYGSLDNLVSMIAINNYGGLNDSNIQTRKVIFDLVLRQDSLLGKYNFQNNINYATNYVTPQPLVYSFELREEGGYELREDGGYELR